MFKEVLEITESATVQMAKKFDELLNKELCLGQTRYVCRYGTLSDGHDKITDSQRYYQCIREMYSISKEMSLLKVSAMRAEADLLEAKKKIETVPLKEEYEKIRVSADVLESETKLHGALISLKDQMRMLDEYNRVRLELQDSVRAQYPEGIEQAEQDNWRALAEYWTLKKQMGALNIPLTHLPLDMESKAEIGMQSNCPELAAWLLVREKEVIQKRFNGNVKAFLEDKFQDKTLTFKK